MALINLYKQSVNSNSLDTNESPKGRTHNFTISLDETSLVETERGLVDIPSITGIIKELPEISYSTSWDIGPISVISKKIVSFTENKFIKMFAQSNKDYRPPIMTDGWTQQIPKSANPLSVTLNFKAYPFDKFHNTTDYRKIIKFLIFLTTPCEYNITDSVSYVATAWKQARTSGEEFGHAIKQATDTFSKPDVQLKNVANAIFNSDGTTIDLANPNFSGTNADEENAVKSLNNLFTAIENMKGSIDPNVGGCPLCYFELPGFINKVSAGQFDVKWLIKDWSFKPALNVTYDEQTALYNPIYVDFKITLETQMVLDNIMMNNMLNQEIKN